MILAFSAEIKIHCLNQYYHSNLEYFSVTKNIIPDFSMVTVVALALQGILWGGGGGQSACTPIQWGSEIPTICYPETFEIQTF